MNDLPPEKQTVLYEWIDEIPLSRRKKNLPRDFSDAVLMAEVVAHFYPKHVDLFNYDQGLKVDTKIYNWNTLNNKVLQKLGIPLDKNTITDLANAKPGTIEKVLWEFKEFVEAAKEEKLKPTEEIETDNDLEQEIAEARNATDIKLLIAKRKEVEEQDLYITELEKKISRVEELIRAKNEKLSKLH